MGFQELFEKRIRIHRAVKSDLIFLLLALGLCACTTLPITKHEEYQFPKETAFVEAPPEKPFEKIGPVRSKVNFSILDPDFNIDGLCRNYYNRSVEELVKFAKKAGGDAVIDVRSVVFYRDGAMEPFKTPECSEDGEEAQVLTRGIAIKWIKKPDLSKK